MISLPLTVGHFIDAELHSSGHTVSIQVYPEDIGAQCFRACFWMDGKPAGSVFIPRPEDGLTAEAIVALALAEFIKLKNRKAEAGLAKALPTIRDEDAEQKEPFGLCLMIVAGLVLVGALIARAFRLL